MSTRRLARQHDLFATEATAEAAPPPVPEDFVQRIRDELHRTLAMVAAATDLPWSTPTKACLAEMRFHSIATWLPAEEAANLRQKFDAELIRIYGPEGDTGAVE